jgi:hypothetical protein
MTGRLNYFLMLRTMLILSTKHTKSPKTSKNNAEFKDFFRVFRAFRGQLIIAA